MPPPVRYSRANCSDGFQKRGWVSRAGGDLYFDGLGGSNHPHLHVRISGTGGVGDIRAGVSMLAWSDGRQGQGGGGVTFIHNGDPAFRVWQNYIASKGMNGAMAEEFSNIMSYFTLG